jgi:MFS family permease
VTAPPDTPRDPDQPPSSFPSTRIGPPGAEGKAAGVSARPRRQRSRRPIRSLFLGTAISRIGDSVTLVGLVWIVYVQTQSASGVALVQFAYTILIPIGGLLVGAVLDRYRVVPVMIADAFIKATVITLVLVAEIAGVAIIPASLVAALYLGMTWMVGGAGLPTLIAGAIEPGGHPQANMFDSLAYSFSAVVGPLIAGVLISTVGPLAALVAGAGCSVAYGLLLVDVRADLLSHVPPATLGAIGVRGIAQGFRLVFGSQLLLSLTLMFVSLNAISTLFSVVVPVYAAQTLNSGAAGYTILLSINSVGQMTGTIIGRYLSPRVGVGRSIIGSVIGGGLLFLPLVFVTSLPAAATVLFIEGLVANSYGPWVQTLRMRVIPPQLRSRAFGSIRTMTNSLSPVGAIVAAGLVPALGINAIWVLIAAGWVATAVGLALVPDLRRSRV